MIKCLAKKLAIFVYKCCTRSMDLVVTFLFKQLVKNIDQDCRVCFPIHLKGTEYIKIGTKFRAAPGFRIEAWDEYLGITHQPQIVIGNNVSIGFNVHIGAIGRMEIGNNVLISSNVLIIDHQHGKSTSEDKNILVVNRPLHSKGNVVIEDNVWIGDGVCVLDGVRVGKNSVIGANTIVINNIPQDSVVGGIPAKILRKI